MVAGSSYHIGKHDTSSGKQSSYSVDDRSLVPVSAKLMLNDEKQQLEIINRSLQQLKQQLQFLNNTKVNK